MDNNKILKADLITPKKDIVFKRLFGTKGNETILKDFLESVLERDVGMPTLDLSTELLPDFYEGKTTRVDIRTKLPDGTEVNIEIQVNPFMFSESRCLQHWAKIFSNTIKEGEKYTSLKKTICIWILDGKRYDEFDDFQSKWEIMNRKNMVSGHFSQLEFYIIELQKFRNLDIIKPSKKNFWLWFIDHTNKELIEMACISNEKIAEARKQLRKIQADEELMECIRLQEIAEWDENTFGPEAMKEAMQEAIKESLEKGKEEGRQKGLQEGRKEGLQEGRKEGLQEGRKEGLQEGRKEGLQEGRKEGLQEGRKEGLQEGRHQERIAVALNLLKLNIPIPQISQATGLSQEEIEKLKNI